MAMPKHIDIWATFITTVKVSQRIQRLHSPIIWKRQVWAIQYRKTKLGSSTKRVKAPLRIQRRHTTGINDQPKVEVPLLNLILVFFTNTARDLLALILKRQLNGLSVPQSKTNTKLQFSWRACSTAQTQRKKTTKKYLIGCFLQLKAAILLGNQPLASFTTTVRVSPWTSLNR